MFKINCRFVKIIAREGYDDIISIIPYEKYYLKFLNFRKLYNFNKIKSIFNKINKYFKNEVQMLLFNIDCNDINSQLITTINKVKLNKPFIVINDIFLRYNQLHLNETDISVILCHEFGHLYYRKNLNVPSIFGKNKMWNDEFYADMYSCQFLQFLNINKIAIVEMFQKMLKYGYDDDNETLDHPCISRRIEMFQCNYYK